MVPRNRRLRVTGVLGDRPHSPPHVQDGQSEGHKGQGDGGPGVVLVIGLLQ